MAIGRDPRPGDNSSTEQIQKINAALEQFEKYQELKRQVAQAEKDKKRHGALDDQLEEMEERGECIYASNFLEKACEGIPDIELPGEYEGDVIRMKILPDGRIVRSKGESDLKFVDAGAAEEEIREARDDYRRQMEELRRKLNGAEDALRQLEGSGR